jgi:hypothetical protein
MQWCNIVLGIPPPPLPLPPPTPLPTTTNDHYHLPSQTITVTNYCQYSKTNEIHFLYSIYNELTASTYFEHYVLILRRCYTNNCYIACMLCLLIATRIEVELQSW